MLIGPNHFKAVRTEKCFPAGMAYRLRHIVGDASDLADMVAQNMFNRLAAAYRASFYFGAFYHVDLFEEIRM